MTTIDPRGNCGTTNKLGLMTTTTSTYGYQYSSPQTEQKSNFSFGGFVANVAAGAALGGLSSALFYGAGKAVDAVKSSIQNAGVKNGSTLVAKPNQGQGFSPKGYKPKVGERTFDGYVKNNVSSDAELKLYTNSQGFNNNKGNVGGMFKRFGVNSHGGISPHVHQPYRNVNPKTGFVYGGAYEGKTGSGLIDLPTAKDVKQLYQYLENGKYR